MRIETPFRYQSEENVINAMTWLQRHGVSDVELIDPNEGVRWKAERALEMAQHVMSNSPLDVFGFGVDIPDEDDAVEFLLRFA